YRDFITFRQKESPCISKLSCFLTPPRPLPRSSRLYAVDFVSKTCAVKPLQYDDLASAITSAPAKGGRIIVIEDLHPSALDILGPSLDIDPVFFADHIVTDLEDPQRSPAPPSVALTPSQILSRKESFHIHYQQMVDLTSNGPIEEFPWVMKTYANVPRSVRRLPRQNSEPQLGIVRGCCSILTKHFTDSWIGTYKPIAIILVDSATSRIVSSDPHNHTIDLRRTPLRRSFESLPRRSSFAEFQASGSPPSQKPNCPPPSLFDYIQSELTSLPLQGGQSSFPTALDIALAGILPPIISEWMVYSEIVANILSRSEFAFSNAAAAPFSESEIIGLQKWRHRLIQSQHKLTATRDYIQHHSHGPGIVSSHDSKSQSVTKDITHLLDKFDRYSQALNCIIPIAPALVQVHDHRRAVADQAFVRRLTYIAFVFVPASWVAAIFSMASEYGPGQPKFWVYFAVSVPFCLALVVGSFL
ncbi:hypothetical protein QBC44DRAFT_405173, partial [Cladorrhinum sp. PSN332]